MPDEDSALPDSVRLLCFKQRRARQVGQTRECLSCAETRIELLVKSHGVTRCYQCLTGHETELHHIYGREIDASATVRISANQHRAIHFHQRRGHAPPALTEREILGYAS